ncbi:hypothetical protein OV079_22520 [Nannocystis pusilla]|uniref:Uncharacterized protein n=1 Tax=Nannocystis pusilla TaxID=889268 RepID=A0A9X3EQ66_9BACT|nr:hypothetical protein [Nannocystis pusilla]MCY1008284.1 hypothetical protein [Nannocystis pusilla]
MRHVLFNLSLSTLLACGGGPPGEDGSTTAGEPATSDAATGTTTDEPPGTTGSGTDTGPTTGLPWPDPTATSGTDGPVDAGPCPNYALVLDRPGPILWATTDGSVWESAFLQPGQGFGCVRVEFDLQTLDNLDEIVAMDPEGCPEYFGIASVFGTQPAGKVLATAFYHPMDRVRGVHARRQPPRGRQPPRVHRRHRRPVGAGPGVARHPRGQAVAHAGHRVQRRPAGRSDDRRRPRPARRRRHPRSGGSPRPARPGRGPLLPVVRGYLGQLQVWADVVP